VFFIKLQEELAIAIGEAGGLRSSQHTHKSKEENHSFESIMSGLSVSTDGSAGCEAAIVDNSNINNAVPAGATSQLE
jgi:hypothetical protein